MGGSTGASRGWKGAKPSRLLSLSHRSPTAVAELVSERRSGAEGAAANVLVEEPAEDILC